MSDVLAYVNPMNQYTAETFKPWGAKEREQFAIANPKGAKDLKTLQTSGLISLLGGAGGVAGAAALFMSRPGTLNGRLVNVALGNLRSLPPWRHQQLRLRFRPGGRCSWPVAAAEPELIWTRQVASGTELRGSSWRRTLLRLPPVRTRSTRSAPTRSSTTGGGPTAARWSSSRRRRRRVEQTGH